MKTSETKKIWTGAPGWKVTWKRGSGGPGMAVEVLPLTLAIRLDTPLRTGTRKFFPASKLIWVSPSRDHLAVKTLEAVLFPN